MPDRKTHVPYEHQVLAAIAMALAPPGTDPNTIRWTDMPELIHELRAQLTNAHGMVDAVMRQLPRSENPA